jgi:predicted phosphohydrolase
MQEATSKPKAGFAVQLLSDTHLEMWERRFYDTTGGLVLPPPFTTIERKARYLALLGDIGYPHQASYGYFLRRMAEKFDKVFVVAGNHEYYNAEVAQTQERMRKVCAEMPDKLYYMDKLSILTDEGVRILGCTLWSHIPDQDVSAVSRRMNDYHLITNGRRKLTVADTNAWHQEELAWLKEELQKAKANGETVVVMTHHAPIEKSCHPQYYGSQINVAFATPLDDIITNPPIAAWLYGHTHYCSEVNTNGVRVISNAMGYPHEHVENFDMNYMVEI